ncbi:MAG: hypothetical protein ACRELA_25005, partial [Candidatus Rokuibacteriota bacterium]
GEVSEGAVEAPSDKLAGTLHLIRVPTTPLAQVAAPALACLYGATAAFDVRDCLVAARLLLGLGPGLTPAGDDALEGPSRGRA